MSKTKADDSKQLVVVGSSAGGIEALSILVANLGPEFPAPVVLAQHLDPTRPSHLAPILERRASLPVVTVSDDTLLEAGKIYVVPSNQHVVIRDGHVGLEKDHGNRPRPSVDLLLSSAARVYGDRLVAVILTGSGSDGAAGAIEVKDLGGTVIIQNPVTAAHPSMPLALPPTAVDHVADIQQIGGLLQDILRGADLPERIQADDEVTLADVLRHVTRQANIDFRQYKPSTLLRRIGRRMAVNHIRTLSDYRSFLEGNREEVDLLARSLLIKVTEFFRDADAFSFLQNDIIPTLIMNGRERGRVLRLWSAGCATGEEAYSLAVLISNTLGHELPEWNVKVFATDIDHQAIDFARRGYYPSTVLESFPEELRAKYFDHQDKPGLRVNRAIRQMVVFGQQDLNRGVPFPRIDMVVCRNLLIYFKPELQHEVLDLFAYSLRHTQGYLFLGKAETAHPTKSVFELVNKKWKVYRCVSGPIAVPVRPLASPSVAAVAKTRADMMAFASGGKETPESAEGLDLTQIRRANELLLRYLPLGIAIIDRSYRIISVNGTGRRLLGIRDGGVDQDFLHSARWLPYGEVRAMIDRVFQERTSLTIPEIELGGRVGGEGQFLTIQMTPMQGAGGEFIMVNITDGSELARLKRKMEALQTEQQQLTEDLGKTTSQLSESNRELQDANEELQAANEEMMLSQEELQATNEEFEATNEELQATNEELETNNEELQATNEELETTNEELQARTAEFQELTRVLTSERVRLSEVVELAPFHVVIMRGPSFIVEKVTPPSDHLFGQDAREGVTFDELAAGPDLAVLREGVRRAFTHDEAWVTPRHAVRNGGVQRFFVFSAIPRHEPDESIKGVVLYAEDVTERMRSEADVQLRKLRLMVDHAEPVVMALFEVPSRTLAHGNRRFFEVVQRYLGLSHEEAVRQKWEDLWFGPDAAAPLFTSIVQTREPRRFREFRLGAEPDTTVWDLSLIPLYQDQDQVQVQRSGHIMLIAVEVTAPVMARDEAERLDRLRDEFLSLASHELRTPLTPLSALADVMERMLEQPRDEKWERQMHYVLGKFRSQIRFLSRLTEDLLDITRLQSGKFSLETKPLSLREVVREAKEQATAISNHPPIVLEEPSDDPLRVAGDELRLTQTVINLLSNALKHASAGPKIELRVRRVVVNGTPRGRVEVRDYGPGVQPADRERLFTKFYQANTPRSSRPGLGLGLYISSRIVEQHGGTIGADDHRPGTTFWLELPLLDD